MKDEQQTRNCTPGQGLFGQLATARLQLCGIALRFFSRASGVVLFPLHAHSAALFTAEHTATRKPATIWCCWGSTSSPQFSLSTANLWGRKQTWKLGCEALLDQFLDCFRTFSLDSYNDEGSVADGKVFPQKPPLSHRKKGLQTSWIKRKEHK